MLAPVALAMAMALAISCAHAPPPVSVTWNQIAALPVPPADHRIAYGDDSQQFGELRLPKGAGPFPVVVLVHGGCWRADYDLAHVGPLAGALTSRGFATWTLEYRRLGNQGGGWPGTFEDVIASADHLATLAAQYELDLSRTIAIGHSAGGHLAFWLAARKKLLAGAISLAGVLDLRRAWELQLSNTVVVELLGGTPEEVPDRYDFAKRRPTRPCLSESPFGLRGRVRLGSDECRPLLRDSGCRLCLTCAPRFPRGRRACISPPRSSSP